MVADSDAAWFVKIKCSNCGEITGNWVEINPDEKHEISGSRGTAHFVMKCKGCKRENSVDILQDRTYSRPIKQEDSGKFVPVVAFDCRGVEITEFEPRVCPSHICVEPFAGRVDRNW